MVWVLEATALPDYRLQLRFSDGCRGLVDLKSVVFSDPRPIVAALRDSRAFAAIAVDADTVVWANGFDLAPEYLRARVEAGAVA